MVKLMILSTKAKGFGIIAEILSILDDIPLGKYKVEIGLLLREAMLINGLLYNSEAWHNVSKKNIVKLMKVDEALLRGILKAHSKTPLEFLYLETGSVPIDWVIKSRRINYLQNILRRDKNELIKNIYNAQKDDPYKGDYVELVKDDLEKTGIVYDEVLISSMSKSKFKMLVKKNVRHAAFVELQNKLKCHKKVNHLKYTAFKTQPYLLSPEFNEEDKKVLAALRSHCIRGIKMNFKNKYKKFEQICPFACEEDDDQNHVLTCTPILEEAKIDSVKCVLEDMDDDVAKQKALVTLFAKLLLARERLLEKEEDPSTLAGVSAVLQQQ